MNIDDIQRLIELVQKHHIAEVEVEAKGVKIKVMGHHAPVLAPAAPAPMHFPMPMPMQMAAPIGMPNGMAAPAAHVPAAPAPAAHTSVPSAAAKAEEGLPPGHVEVLSPMVGTFYRSPSPDSAPFVSEGSKVSEDTTVCIIEAMKLMNEIKAEAKGTIAKMLVENGQPVQFNQPLYWIKKG